MILFGPATWRLLLQPKILGGRSCRTAAIVGTNIYKGNILESTVQPATSGLRTNAGYSTRKDKMEKHSTAEAATEEKPICGHCGYPILGYGMRYYGTYVAHQELYECRDVLKAAIEAEKQQFKAHTESIAAFLQEMYAIMVDPLADGVNKVQDTVSELKAAALRDREVLQELDKLRADVAKLVEALRECDWMLYGIPHKTNNDIHKLVILALAKHSDKKDYTWERLQPECLKQS